MNEISPAVLIGGMLLVFLLFSVFFAGMSRQHDENMQAIRAGENVDTSYGCLVVLFAIWILIGAGVILTGK